MKIQQTLQFKKSAKKLNHHQKKLLDKAIRKIIEEPQCGQMKKGDLTGVRVYKFKMNDLLTLLAYTVDRRASEITLLMLGSHENFYKDLKNN